MEMGKKWKKTAFYKYQQVMKKGKHMNFHVKQCGMFVNATGIMSLFLVDLFLVIVTEMEFWRLNVPQSTLMKTLNLQMLLKTWITFVMIL